MKFREHIQARQKELEEAKQAEERFLEESARATQVDRETPPAEKDAKQVLGQIWTAVTEAMNNKGFPADVMIVDERRKNELPPRWPEPRRAKKRQHFIETWNEIADGLAVPAWDMRAGHWNGNGGVSDTYSVVQHHMYLGGNAVLYCGLSDDGRTPNDTYTGYAYSYLNASDVPGKWYPEWGAGSYDGREDVVKGLVNLAVEHSLDIDI